MGGLVGDDAAGWLHHRSGPGRHGGRSSPGCPTCRRTTRGSSKPTTPSWPTPALTLCQRRPSEHGCGHLDRAGPAETESARRSVSSSYPNQPPLDQPIVWVATSPGQSRLQRRTYPSSRPAA